jgi:predicted regulator of Ras-like GTPase activity (Roadblock/LC7/MglB family)
MAFEPVLECVVGACRGALGAALWGVDGIPIAQVARTGSGRDPLAEDSGVWGLELNRIFTELRGISAAAGTGGLSEIWVRLDDFSLGLWQIDTDLVFALALEPHGNLGQARYLIRRNLEAIRSQVG